MLGLTIQQMQPQLESQRSALLQQEEQLKLQLAGLERQLLHSLATSKVRGKYVHAVAVLQRQLIQRLPPCQYPFPEDENVLHKGGQ